MLQRFTIPHAAGLSLTLRARFIIRRTSNRHPHFAVMCGHEIHKQVQVVS